MAGQGTSTKTRQDGQPLSRGGQGRLGQIGAGLREGLTARGPSASPQQTVQSSQPVYDKKFDEIVKRYKEDDLLQREKDAVNTKPETEDTTTPEDVNAQEESGDQSLYRGQHRDSDYAGKHREPEYEGRHRKPDSKQKGRWNPFKQSYKGKHHKPIHGIRRGLMVGGIGLLSTIMFMGIVAWILLLVAPYKHVHFADILRTIGFARFTYQMNRQFARVVVDASVLTDRSTGTFPRGSLVNRLPLVNPERQLAQINRQAAADGRAGIRWDFAEEGGRWRGFIRGENVYRGVEVNGRRIDLDQQSREMFGRNFDELRVGQRYQVEAAHANAYRNALGENLSTLSRSQYWGAYRAFHQATDIRLYGWLNSGRNLLGKGIDSAARLKISVWEATKRIFLIDRFERIVQNFKARVSRLSIIQEDGEFNRQQTIDAIENGRPPPGEIRNRLAERLRVVGNVSYVVLAATIACVVHDMKVGFEDAEREREQLAARAGNLPLSEADQIKGDEELEPIAANLASDRWSGAEQSPLYRQSVGRPLTQQDAEALLEIPGVSIQRQFAAFIDWADLIMFQGPADDVIPGVVEAKEAACDFFMKPGVQWSVAGAEVIISIATAGAARGIGAGIRAGVEGVALLAAGMGLGQIMGTMIDNRIKEVAGLDFSGLGDGAQTFDESYVGINLSQQVGNRLINFGRPMSIADADEAQAVAVENIKSHYQTKPFTTRYFAIDNPFSLSGRFAATMPASSAGLANSARSGLASLGSILTSPARIIGTVLGAFSSNNIARAEVVVAPGTNVGVLQWGWTTAEQNLIDTDSRFGIPVSCTETNGQEPCIRPGETAEQYCGRDPQNFVCYMEYTANIDTLNDRYWPCYNPEEFIFQADTPEDCTEELLAGGHEEYGDDALYWRHYMAQLYAAGRLTGDM